VAEPGTRWLPRHLDRNELPQDHLAVDCDRLKVLKLVGQLSTRLLATKEINPFLYRVALQS
jgi:hypothetical protein